jgi:uncharacterized membrane protein
LTTSGSASRAGAGTTRVVLVAAMVEALAIAVWLGGLLVLGAIVAPTVFRVVHAPLSADAMTLVFRRFDRVAMTAAAVALIAEVVLATRGGRVSHLDLVRGLSVVVAGALAVLVGAHLSPTIEALHRGGAVRGFGETGLALERAHRLAEACGKGQLGLLVVALLLLFVKVARAR